MTVSLVRFAFGCGRCGQAYEDGLLVGGYGTLVVHDEDGRHPAVAPLLDAALLPRVSEAVEARRSARWLPRTVVGGVVQRAYLLLCDPSPGGARYDPRAHPACPSCGAQPRTWRELSPVRVEAVDLPEVSTRGFDAALPQEQERALDAAVTQALREARR